MLVSCFPLPFRLLVTSLYFPLLVMLMKSDDLRETVGLEITLTAPLCKTCSIGVRSWFVLDLLTHFCRTGTGIEDQKDSCHYEVKDSYTD